MLSTESFQACSSVSATNTSRTRPVARCGVRRFWAPSSSDSQCLDVAGVQVEAHRQEAALAGHLERVRVLAETGDPDRRVRLLERHDVRLEGPDWCRLGHGPVLAHELERAVSVHSLRMMSSDSRVISRLARQAVHVEHRPVARQAAGGDAEVEPPLRQVIEHRDAIGQFGGVVVRQQEAAGPEPDVLRPQDARATSRSAQGAAPTAPRGARRSRLPCSQVVGPPQHLQVPLLAVVEAALRGCDGMVNRPSPSTVSTFSRDE